MCMAGMLRILSFLFPAITGLSQFKTNRQVAAKAVYG